MTWRNKETVAVCCYCTWVSRAQVEDNELKPGEVLAAAWRHANTNGHKVIVEREQRLHIDPKH